MNGSTENKFKVVKFDSDTKINGISKFDCEDKILNDFLKQFKRQCERENIFGILLQHGDKTAAFATASLYQLGRDVVPQGTFPYSVPSTFAVMKIPMIAVDKQYKKQGWGKQMLRAILDYCIESAERVKGIKGVYLDAKVESRAFYEKYNFVALSEEVSSNNTIPMFISMDTLRDSRRLEKSA